MVGLLTAAPAAAQVGASVSLYSDYRYRSYSLSEEQPAAALNLSYDHGSGLYAGGSLIAADRRYDGWGSMGHVAYAGYARRLSRGPSLDLGVSSLRVKYHELPSGTVNNDEVYAGVAGDHASLRVSYSPDYFDLDQKTVYVDLGLAFRPAPDWRVFGHAGVLRRVGGDSPSRRRERYDLSVGVARRIGPAEIVLQATRTGPGRNRGPDFEGLQVSASWFF